jgi:hypothetical protein
MVYHIRAHSQRKGKIPSKILYHYEQQNWVSSDSGQEAHQRPLAYQRFAASIPSYARLRRIIQVSKYSRTAASRISLTESFTSSRLRLASPTSFRPADSRGRKRMNSSASVTADAAALSLSSASWAWRTTDARSPPVASTPYRRRVGGWCAPRHRRVGRRGCARRLIGFRGSWCRRRRRGRPPCGARPDE